MALSMYWALKERYKIKQNFLVVNVGKKFNELFDKKIALRVKKLPSFSCS